MDKKERKIEKKDLKSLKLYLLLAFAFVFFSFFDKVSPVIILGSVLLFITAIFFKKNLFYFLIISIPFLSLGKVLFIPVTQNWIYEARVPEISFLFVFLVYILDKFVNNRLSEIKIDKIIFSFFAFAGLSLASFHKVIDLRYFIFGMKALAYSGISYFLFINLMDSQKKIRALIFSFSSLVFILSLQLFYKFYQMGFSSKFFFERSYIEIPIGPIATAAAIIAFLLPLILVYYISHRDNLSKIFILLSFLLGSFAVFMTMGKAAIASLFIALFYIFIRIKKVRMIFVFSFLWFFLIASIILNPYLTGFIERIQTTLVDANTEFRILEYKTSMKIIDDNFYIGTGVGQQLHHFKKLLNNDNPQLVNNFFLQVMIDFGLIGISILSFMIFRIFIKIRKMFNNKNDNILVIGLFASILVAFLNGLFEVTFFAVPYVFIFWPLLALLNNFEHYETLRNNN